MAYRSGKPDEPSGGFRRRAVLGLVVGCVGFIAGRAHYHDYQGDMRSGGRFEAHRRTARRLAQDGNGMKNCQVNKTQRMQRNLPLCLMPAEEWERRHWGLEPAWGIKK